MAAGRKATHPRQPERLEIPRALIGGPEPRSSPPRVIVCLGATAAQALFGRSARVGELRGRPHPLSPGTRALVTIHPAAVLRAGERRAELRAGLLADLALSAELLEGVEHGQTAKKTKS